MPLMPPPGGVTSVMVADGVLVVAAMAVGVFVLVEGEEAIEDEIGELDVTLLNDHCKTFLI